MNAKQFEDNFIPGGKRTGKKYILFVMEKYREYAEAVQFLKIYPQRSMVEKGGDGAWGEIYSIFDKDPIELWEEMNEIIQQYEN